jgi:hypothetical protein
MKNHIDDILRQERAFLYFDIWSFGGVGSGTDYSLVIAKVRERPSLGE